MLRNERKTLMFGYIVILFLLSAMSFRVYGAITNQSFLPIIYGRSVQPVAGVVTLRESDTTFLSATYDLATKRILVAFVDRAHGNRVHETELISNTLVEVQLTAIMNTAQEPSFTVPDSSKEAAVSQFVLDGWHHAT